MPGRAALPLAACRLFGRLMEVFAGFLTQPDHQAGPLIAFPLRLGELDDTLITVIPGNGSEGRVSDETEADKGEH